MAHRLLKEEPKAPVKSKIIRLQGKFFPGRLGVSFYIGKKELFVGFEISHVVIPPKTKRYQKKIKKANVTFVPTRE